MVLDQLMCGYIEIVGWLKWCNGRNVRVSSVLCTSELCVCVGGVFIFQVTSGRMIINNERLFWWTGNMTTRSLRIKHCRLWRESHDKSKRIVYIANLWCSLMNLYMFSIWVCICRDRHTIHTHGLLHKMFILQLLFSFWFTALQFQTVAIEYPNEVVLWLDSTFITM